MGMAQDQDATQADIDRHRHIMTAPVAPARNPRMVQDAARSSRDEAGRLPPSAVPTGPIPNYAQSEPGAFLPTSPQEVRDFASPSDIARGVNAGQEAGLSGAAQLPGWLIHQGGRAVSRIAGKGSRVGADISRAGEAVQKAGATAAAAPAKELGDPTWEPDYQPRTVPGRVAKEGAEVGTSVALGGGLRGAVKYGVVPGVVGQGAEEATKDSPAFQPIQKYIKPAIEMGTGGVTAVLEKGASAAAEMLQKSLKGLRPGEAEHYLNEAERLVQQNAAAGRPITRAEALYTVSNGRIDMRGAQHAAETSGDYPQLNRMIEERGQLEGPGRPAGPVQRTTRRAQDIIQSPAEMVEPRPGAPEGPQQPIRRSAIGPEMKSSTMRIAGQTEQAINERTAPLFRQAEPVQLHPNALNQLEQNDVYVASRDAVRNDARLRYGTNNAPENTVEFQDQVLKHLREEQANEYAAGHKLAGNALRDTANELEQTLNQATGSQPLRPPVSGTGPAAPPVEGTYEEARGQQAAIRGEVVNPFTEGPASKIYNRANPNTQQAINAVFDENADPVEVHHYMQQIAQDNPYLAQAVVREYAARVFNKAMKQKQGGPNPMASGNIVKELAGGDRKAEVFRAAVEALPGGAERYQGLQRLFDDYFRPASARLPTQSSTATQTRQLEKMKGGGPALTDIAHAVTPPTPTKLVGALKLPEVAQRKLDQWRQGKNLEQLGSLLTDPEAGMRFRQLLREPTGSKRGLALAARLMVLAGMSTRNTSLGNRAVGAKGNPAQ